MNLRENLFVKTKESNSSMDVDDSKEGALDFTKKSEKKSSSLKKHIVAFPEKVRSPYGTLFLYGSFSFQMFTSNETHKF